MTGMQQNQEVGLSIQQRLKSRWMAQLTRGFANTVCVARVPGRLNPAALAASAALIVARHSALRTRYREIGGELAGILQEACAPAVTIEDEPAADKAVSRLDDWAFAEIDIDASCLLGCKAIQCADHALVAFRIPHFVGDAVSADIIFAEFAAIYPASLLDEEPNLSLLSVDYAAYVRRQEERRAATGWETRILDWKARYSCLPVLSIPLAWGSGGENSVRSVCLFSLDKTGLDGFFAAARSSACPPEIAVLALVAKILGEWLGLNSFILPTVNRGRSSSEDMGIVGLFLMEIGVPVTNARAPLEDLMRDMFRQWTDLNRDGAFPAWLALHDVMGDRLHAMETNVMADFSAAPRTLLLPPGGIERVPYHVRIENAPPRRGLYILVHGDREALSCRLFWSSATLADDHATRLQAIAQAITGSFVPTGQSS